MPAFARYVVRHPAFFDIHVVSGIVHGTNFILSETSREGVPTIAKLADDALLLVPNGTILVIDNR